MTQKPAEVYVRRQEQTKAITVDDLHHHADNADVLVMVKDEWDATRWVHWSDVERVVGLPRMDDTESQSNGSEPAAEPEDSDADPEEDGEDYMPQARKKARQILLELNPQVEECDLVEEVSTIHKNGSIAFDASRSVPSDPGTTWREFTDEHFGVIKQGDEPGYITWGQTDDGTSYPDEFVLPYSGLQTVLEAVES